MFATALASPRSWNLAHTLGALIALRFHSTRPTRGSRGPGSGVGKAADHRGTIDATSGRDATARTVAPSALGTRMAFTTQNGLNDTPRPVSRARRPPWLSFA